MNKALNQKANFWKAIPVWGWFIGAIFFALECVIFFSNRAIVLNFYHGWMFVPKTPVLDDAIPLFPYFFIQIYFMAFGFWVIFPIGIMFTKKGNYWNYILAQLTSFLIILIIYFSYPTYVDRVGDGLVEKVNAGVGWSYDIMRFLYANDGNGIGYGALPSIHVLMSILPWMFIVGRKELPLWFRIPVGICMWLVIPSTLLTKQHYIIDVIGSLLLCATVFCIYHIPNIGLKIENYLANKKKKRV